MHGEELLFQNNNNLSSSTSSHVATPEIARRHPQLDPGDPCDTPGSGSGTKFLPYSSASGSDNSLDTTTNLFAEDHTGEGDGAGDYSMAMDLVSPTAFGLNNSILRQDLHVGQNNNENEVEMVEAGHFQQSIIEMSPWTKDHPDWLEQYWAGAVDKTLTVHGITIFSQDIECLDAGNWVNDNLVEARIREFCPNGTTSGPLIVKNTFFTQRLAKHFDDEDWLQREAWAPDVRFIIVPVNIPAVHWYLIIISGLDTCQITITLIDSIPNNHTLLDHDLAEI